MTLTKLLTENTFATDQQALDAATAHTETPLKLIPCETVNSLLAQTNLRVALKKIAADEASPFQNAADTFIDSTFTGNAFNFTTSTTAGDKQVQMLDQMIAANLSVDINGSQYNITQPLTDFKNLVLPMANKSTQPFANVTMTDVKAIRSPATWQPVSMAANQIVTPEGDLISNSDRAGFRFTLTPAESFTGRVNIRIWAKTANDTTFTLQTSYPIVVSGAFTAAQAQTHFFKRIAGLSNYRHFKFEYETPYADALTDVSVEGVA